MSSPTDNTEEKQSNLIPFKPGQSGNPRGRPKGARNKLGEAFLEDLLSAWERDGAQAIQRVIDTKPEVFVRVVADVLPKELNLKRDPLEDLTDDQLIARVVAARRATDEILRQQGRLHFVTGEGSVTAHLSQYGPGQTPQK